MRIWIIYYAASHQILDSDDPPQEHEFPHSLFAEGPLRSVDDAIARLKWMGRLPS